MATKRKLERIGEAELIKAHTLYWIDREKIVNEDEKPMDFHTFYFLVDLYTCRTKKKAVKKSGQSGVSTYGILMGNHRARYQGINVIHTLPADADVVKFVPSKVDQIIRYNRTRRTEQGRRGEHEQEAIRQRVRILSGYYPASVS